jgi:hypothetical protein
VVVVRGTDPVTYFVTSKEPVGTRRAVTYDDPLASDVTVTLPTNEVFPDTVNVSVTRDGLTPMPTFPPL